jgi:hypothetical protein
MDSIGFWNRAHCLFSIIGYKPENPVEARSKLPIAEEPTGTGAEKEPTGGAQAESSSGSGVRSSGREPNDLRCASQECPSTRLFSPF